MSSPSDDELLQACTKLRSLHPHLGRAKFLTILKEENSWVLSEARLKKCLDNNNLNAKPENISINSNTDNQSSSLPRDGGFQKIIRAAFNDFKVRERNFFLAMPVSQCRKISPENPTPMYGACHMRHHIEFLLALKGIKPCTIFAHYTAQNIFTEMVEKCLKPVFDKYKLLQYGYYLGQITHKMPTTVHRGFQHAWVFADTRSSQWPEVKDVFLTPHDQPIEDTRVGKVLGYPVVNGKATFRAVDYTEMADLKTASKQDVCCVSGYEFFCDNSPEHFGTLMYHFDRCHKAAQEFGIELRMDLAGHQNMATWVAMVKSGSW